MSSLGGRCWRYVLLRLDRINSRNDEAGKSGCGDWFEDHIHALLLLCGALACGVAEIFPKCTNLAMIDPTVRL